jgi:Spy/CpxP family protein refolding chaperone
MGKCYSYLSYLNFEIMNTRNMKFAGALLLGLLMVINVNAQSRQGGRGSGPYGAGEAKADRIAWLDLTEVQQEEINTLRTEHYKEITPLRNKMAELRARERTLLSEENADMKAIELNIDEQTDLMNSMRKLQTKHQISIKSILTDEQVMKLQQRRQFAQRDGFHGKSGRRGDRGMHMDRSLRGYRGI